MNTAPMGSTSGSATLIQRDDLIDERTLAGDVHILEASSSMALVRLGKNTATPNGLTKTRTRCHHAKSVVK